MNVILLGATKKEKAPELPSPSFVLLNPNIVKHRLHVWLSAVPKPETTPPPTLLGAFQTFQQE